MEEKRQTFHPKFREGAVRIVGEDRLTVAEAAMELGIDETTQSNWCSGPPGRDHADR
jgi:transposase-like protein